MTQFTYKRRRARHMLVQALYQYQLNEAPANHIIAEYLSRRDAKQADVVYFQTLFENIILEKENLDNLFTPHLDRALKDLNPIELAILRLGTYELKERLDIPFRVVLNEALELAKHFGATDSHKYVNAILDKLSTILRQCEKKT